MPEKPGSDSRPARCTAAKEVATIVSFQKPSSPLGIDHKDLLVISAARYIIKNTVQLAHVPLSNSILNVDRSPGRTKDSFTSVQLCEVTQLNIDMSLFPRLQCPFIAIMFL